MSAILSQNDVSEGVSEKEPKNPVPCGGHVITPEARAKGEPARLASLRAPRLHPVFTKLLKRKANLNVIRAALTEREKPIFNAIMAYEIRETDPETGECGHCTNMDALVGTILARAMVRDSTATTVMDRMEGRPAQEVRIQERVTIETIVPPQMQEVVDERKRRYAAGDMSVVDAEYDVEE
jgi:hypothetical protein